ncbi:Ldh family oxidoreductase [Candidatus Dependentiae bacterium]|nr:Ldh family oxidoreductase [Candidatus Dependentiae bacterium]
MRYSVEVIVDKISQILISKGLTSDEASLIAKVLIEGDQRGYPAHGIERLWQLLDGIEQGTLSIQSQPTILSKRGAVEVWDGRYGLGQVIGHKAMLQAINLAKNYGIGLVGVINAGHLGVLAYYSELASKESCVGIVLSTSSPAVVLNGGAIKTLGTNPISFSFPSLSFPITADFATSKVSRGRLLDAKDCQQTIPLEWAVDEKGIPTTDPCKALKGGLQVFDAGHKGACLSFLISILAGPLIGGVANDLVRGTRDMSAFPNKGDFFLVFDIASLTNLVNFLEQIEHFLEFIRQQQSDFIIPGLKERAHTVACSKNGIYVSKRMQSLFDQLKI